MALLRVVATEVAATGEARREAKVLFMNTIAMVAENEHTALVLCEFVRVVLAEGCSSAEVSPACSVDDLLDVLAKGPIDVLVTEDRLTGLTGTGLIRWLEKLLARTTTILLTSDPESLRSPGSSLAPNSTKFSQNRWSESLSSARCNGGLGGRQRSWRPLRRSSRTRQHRHQVITRTV